MVSKTTTIALFLILIIVMVSAIFLVAQPEPLVLNDIEEFQYPYATADMPGAIQDHVSVEDWDNVNTVWCQREGDELWMSYAPSRPIQNLFIIETDWICSIKLKDAGTITLR